MPVTAYRSEYHVSGTAADAATGRAPKALARLETTVQRQLVPYRRVVIFGRSFDADLVAFGALAVAALLYGGL